MATPLAAPFPYFGGKRRAAQIVWSSLSPGPQPYDAKAAGWWIGDPFGPGPWRVVDGHLRKLPHLGDAGRGRCVQGKAGGGAGYNADALAGRRERIWLSPACIGQDTLDLGEVG